MLTGRAAEQAFCIQKGLGDAVIPELPVCEEADFRAERLPYTLAKSLFDAKEFDRTVFVLKHCKSKKSIFLRSYARFLVSEREITHHILL